MDKKKTVYVGMSGGVDSSVAAALLKERGFDVKGVFIRTWQPDFLPCTWREERADAMRAAAHLSIPFETYDFQEEYRRTVVDYMISEYRMGRTPNPDVMCNKSIKFGSFFDKALSEGADYIATGHYAQIKSNNTEFELHAGVDEKKDQSYFLWTLSSHILSHTLFPVGEYKKSEVRELAKKYGLHNAEKKDSQGICFLGQVEMEEFLSHYIPSHPGNVMNIDGAVIGSHSGVRYYTLGQRHGFEVVVKTPTDGPYYVVAKDIPSNVLVATAQPEVRESFGSVNALLKNVNWIPHEPEENREYRARIRYRQPLQKCTIVKKDEAWELTFNESQKAVTPGQSAVLYDGTKCLGGGIIS